MALYLDLLRSVLCVWLLVLQPCDEGHAACWKGGLAACRTGPTFLLGDFDSWQYDDAVHYGVIHEVSFCSACDEAGTMAMALSVMTSQTNC